MRIPILILALTFCAAAQEHKVGVNRYVIPQYPLIAHQAKVQGHVVIDLKLDANGEISSLSVVRGHPMLKQAAVDAVKHWRFVCLDCKPNQSFSQKLSVAFEILKDDCVYKGEKASRVYTAEDWKVTLDFPDKITVTVPSPCADITVTYASAR